MTSPTLPRHPRAAVVITVMAARLLARLRPHRIRWILTQARRGASPATAEQALAAHQAITAVSSSSRSRNCLQRSLATVLLARTRGAWPDWCTGVRTGPFRAHAWVAVDGLPIGESEPPGYYQPMITISCPTTKERRDSHPPTR